MKRLYILAVAVLVSLSFSTITFAAAQSGTNGGSGADLTITDSDAGNVGFTFSPSPNMSLGYNIPDGGASFAINAQNDVTDTTNGIEYGMASDSNEVYKRQKTAATLSAPTDADSGAFSSW